MQVDYEVAFDKLSSYDKINQLIVEFRLYYAWQMRKDMDEADSKSQKPSVSFIDDNQKVQYFKQI